MEGQESDSESDAIIIVQGWWQSKQKPDEVTVFCLRFQYNKEEIYKLLQGSADLRLFLGQFP